MTSAPPPLPPDGPDTKRRSPFTWKTYLDAIIWIAPALVLSNFCAIVVHPRVEGIWEASGVETANRTIHWMKDFSGAGLFCAKVGLACLGLLIAGTEVMLKGHPQVRQIGCRVLAFSTNLAALTMITSSAIVLCTITPIAQERLATYRRAAGLCGILPATEKLATFGSAKRVIQAQTLDAAEVGNLDSSERYDLLDAAVVLVEHSDNLVIQHQILGQALALLSYETDEEAEIMSERLLTAAGTMRDAPFETIDQLTAWYESDLAQSDWQALPVSVVR